MKRVLLRMPFESEGDWEAEIDRSVERDIERLQSEIEEATTPHEDDRKFLKALEAGDVDYEAILRAAGPEYVTQFSEAASAVLGVDLDLRFETMQFGADTAIGASMPITVARKLLKAAKESGAVERSAHFDDIDAGGWGDLLERWLPDASDLEERVFADMAESTDVFYPLG